MISFVEMSIVADCVFQIFNVDDFLKMLTIFKSRLFELMKHCLKRRALNFLDLDEVASVNDEKLNSKSEILESR